MAPITSAKKSSSIILQTQIADLFLPIFSKSATWRKIWERVQWKRALPYRTKTLARLQTFESFSRTDPEPRDYDNFVENLLFFGARLGLIHSSKLMLRSEDGKNWGKEIWNMALVQLGNRLAQLFESILKNISQTKTPTQVLSKGHIPLATHSTIPTQLRLIITKRQLKARAHYFQRYPFPS